MCTLSWLVNTQGYEVFFNRDEQRNRAKATTPFYDNVTDSLMPIDPQGGGTWIAVNANGITLCLLNNYQAAAKITKKNHKSRGSLIPLLLKFKTHDEILQSLYRIKLKDFLPFWLCIFPQDFKKDNESMNCYQWDGNILTVEKSEQPLVSSAVCLAEVQDQRHSLFNKTVQPISDTEQHLSFHSSHLPEKGKFSVCMHRQDAHTQSLSHIVVGHTIVFRYHAGAPCKADKWDIITLPVI
jgi:hypothetical protein